MFFKFGLRGRPAAARKRSAPFPFAGQVVVVRGVAYGRQPGWQCWLLLGVLCLAPGDNLGAQVVQLPTFEHFTVSTVVSVPDGGSMAIAGGGHLAEGYASTSRAPLFGPLGAWRSRGRSLHVPQLSLTSSVTDLRERDAHLQALAASREWERIRADRDDRAHGELPLALGRTRERHTATGATGDAERRAAGPVDPGHFSVEQLRRQREAAESRKHEEPRAWFRRAEVAERAGKTVVARAYYRNALRDADADLEREIATRLRELR